MDCLTGEIHILQFRMTGIQDVTFNTFTVISLEQTWQRFNQVLL